MTIGIIGSGNMGTALCKAFIRQDVTTEDKIFVCDLHEEKLKPLADMGINTTSKLEDLFSCDVIMLAVKPQGFSDLAKEIKGKLDAETVVLSIMAAVSIDKMQDQLDHQRVVRCMPNTPALISKGVIGWFADSSLSEEQKKSCEVLLNSAGHSLEVSSEEMLDDITALSGSGPGFFYAVIEAWRDAAQEKLSLSPEACEELLLKTLSGSLKLAESSDKQLSELREQVTSKGGVTAAGLTSLEKNDLKKAFSEMFAAALKRTKELNT